MLFVAVSSLHVDIAGIVECVAFEACILKRASETLLMGLLSPVWPRIVVESRRCHELTVQEFPLVLDVVFDGGFTSQIIVVL